MKTDKYDQSTFLVLKAAYLYYISEKPQGEIAEELGISSNLVSQWKRRASAWLRKVYEERENV